MVVADIRDDGVGFTSSETDGFGLTAMRRRVSRLSGEVEVELAPGRGTAVSVSVPAIPATGERETSATDAGTPGTLGHTSPARTARTGRPAPSAWASRCDPYHIVLGLPYSRR